MAEGSDDEDYIFFGTPIEDEAEAKGGRRQAVDPGKTRSAPVWDQVPTDDQGRKRFHGAFTGGFSAGYFNTVGSKEGFQPATFRSSRSDRAAVKQQSLDDFLDEDERQERGKATLQVQPQFDTFGFAAAEVARGISQRDAAARPSLIPGPAIDELVAPVPTSIGVELLHKMGWRGGRGIAQAPMLPGEDRGRRSKWGTVAGVSLDNTPLYVLEPKQDVHGLGFDPFSGAEDFRQLKRQRTEAKQRSLQQAAADATSKLGMGGGAGRHAGGVGQKRPRGLPFGGFTEDSGMYGYVEDYADQDDDEGGGGQPPTKMSVLTGGGLKGYSFELMGSESDEEGPVGRGRRPLLLGDTDRDAPLMIESTEQLRKGGDFIPGFTKSDEQVVFPRYPPPEVPPTWAPHCVFHVPVPASNQQDAMPPPPEVPPPDDQELKKQIDSLAAMVARTGAAVEVLARKQAQQAKQQRMQEGGDGGSGSHHFEFLLGGEGSLYYTWRLYKIRSALAVLSGTGIGAAAGQDQQAGTKPTGGRGALSVEQRMAMLGEQALPSFAEARQALATAQGLAGAAEPQRAVAEGDKVRLREALNSMFVKAEQQDLGMGPDAQVGLRQGGKTEALPPPPALGLAASGSSTAATVLAGLGDRFKSTGATETFGIESRGAGLLQGTSGGAGSKGGVQGSSKEAELAAAAAKQPTRWFEDWRPDPVVCKRFNVPDPYKGKAAVPQMPKFRTEYLALPETSMGLHLPAEDAAAGGAGAGADQQQLPPPPPVPINIQDAVARAAAIAQKLGASGVGVEAQAPVYPPPPPLSTLGQRTDAGQAAALDAKGYAASFLSSLMGGSSGGAGGDGGGTRQQEAAAQAGPSSETEMGAEKAGSSAQAGSLVGAGDDVAPSADFPSVDRPLDIFKAIFEAEDDDEEEEEDGAQAETEAAAGQVQGGSGQGPGADTSDAPVVAAGPAKQAPAPVAATPQQVGLAAALIRAQQVAADKAAADAVVKQQQQAQQAQQQLQAGDVQAGGVQGPGVLPAQQVDPEVQQRILAALALLKRGKKEKDKHKKKSKSKKKHSSKKESTSKHKSKQKSSKSRKAGKRSSSRASDSDGSSESDSDSAASSSSG